MERSDTLHTAQSHLSRWCASYFAMDMLACQHNINTPSILNSSSLRIMILTFMVIPLPLVASVCLIGFLSLSRSCKKHAHAMILASYE
jgi:hypothetical protein